MIRDKETDVYIYGRQTQRTAKMYGHIVNYKKTRYNTHKHTNIQCRYKGQGYINLINIDNISEWFDTCKLVKS